MKYPPYKAADLSSTARLPTFLAPYTAVADPADGRALRLYQTDDHPFNRRGFRYIPCEVTPDLPALMYRQVDVPPYGARASFEDMSTQILVDRATATVVSTDKGFRMVRANVGVREGTWFWECRILHTSPAGAGNVRPGWTRREASLETPVGFDAYGYGVRDTTGQKMHISRGEDLLDGPLHTGDVLGLEIRLPSLADQLARARTHAGDPGPAPAISNVVRDRIPVRYKDQLYFEQFESMPAKALYDLLNPDASTAADTQKIAAVTAELGLPGSSIRVFRNGALVGTAFEALLPFLPPHSEPLQSLGGRVTDDGMLGYFPSISVYKGGVAQFNFGPQFDHTPADLAPDARPMCDRFDEQIAEDIVWDIVDEVEFEEVDAELDRERRASDEKARKKSEAQQKRVEEREQKKAERVASRLAEKAERAAEKAEQRRLKKQVKAEERAAAQALVKLEGLADAAPAPPPPEV
ncbi:uncharacterized protein V1510DRAFT_422887 [Dipodascopsis tothii]|uniref:uncharacterized protein n=1 Tax=Dipodascopsis tothii TaxID=44089 RepID=UPI0034CE9AFE